MGKYVMTAARKAAFRKAQEKAWAMRRAGKTAAPSAKKAVSRKSIERPSKTGKTIYDNPTTGESASVEKIAGEWYIDTGKFDASAKSEKELLNKLKNWGFKDVAGWE